MTTIGEHITLSQLLADIKTSLMASYPFSIWITAEIGEMKVNSSSGHCYLELIEKGGKNGVPSARVNATIWRNTYIALSDYFFSVTQRPLETGLKILTKVSVNFHELYGLSLQINDIDPKYTLGEQEQQRLQTIDMLKADGVFELNKELEIPIAIQNIAVISSIDAAGYRDFMKELQISPFRVETTLFQAYMQGNEAEGSIITALDDIAEKSENFDVVVIIRGGGSQSDLSCFNSYELCCNVAQFPLPVITGIGHDKDQSVTDMVAAVSLKTPTAVAQYILGTLEDVFNKLEYMHNKVIDSTSDTVYNQHIHIQNLSLSLGRHTTLLTRNIDKKLTTASITLSSLSKKFLVHQTMRLNRSIDIMPARIKHTISVMHNKLYSAEKIISNSRPETVLSRGFSIVRLNGTAIKDATILKENDNIEITFSKGIKTAKITKDGKENKL